MTESSPPKNPYTDLENRAFWRAAIASRSPFSIQELWRPKFQIKPKHKVATYGSCFAQHIGKSLRERGYGWLITEQPPKGFLRKDAAATGYGIFSSRTANIYTASLLRQWLSWATGAAEPPAEVWEKNGRFYDPFRPAIENSGFESAEEVWKLRAHTIKCFHESVLKADFFVFTMGLTESWSNIAGHEYPMCPGTAAGTFSPDVHKFHNQDYEFIIDAMREAMAASKSINPNIRFILTVSPVPLTATASGNHVLVATMESKSILRAVAAKLSKEREDTDYFPSYEIINGTPFGGMFFEPNKRNVAPTGVQFVMNSFFAALGGGAASQAPVTGKRTDTPEDDYEGCEEAMLEVYSG